VDIYKAKSSQHDPHCSTAMTQFLSGQYSRGPAERHRQAETPRLESSAPPALFGRTGEASVRIIVSDKQARKRERILTICDIKVHRKLARTERAVQDQRSKALRSKLQPEAAENLLSEGQFVLKMKN